MSRNGCKENRSDVTNAARALYLHVPFCAAKCRYCDFYSMRLAGRDARTLVRALGAELELHRHWLGLPLETVFVGGGTPTCLGPAVLEELLAMLRPLAGQGTEFTVEANPGTVESAVGDVLVRCGVNRVSLGVQSMQEGELAVLGRIHTPRQARQAVDDLRRAGIANLSLDLMYGLPGQTTQSWASSLGQVLAMGPSHMSAYALSFEPGTPLHEDQQAGRVTPMADELQRELYYAAADSAAGVGLRHYEISNFAIPAKECRHNLTYWRNQPYLGLGPAAASYLGGTRRTNAADLDSYCEAVLAGRAAPAQEERIVGKMAMAETVMLGLRLIDGLDRTSFAERYGIDVTQAFPATTARYRAVQGPVPSPLVLTGSRLSIAREHLFAADTILAEFIAEAS